MELDNDINEHEEADLGGSSEEVQTRFLRTARLIYVSNMSFYYNMETSAVRLSRVGDTQVSEITLMNSELLDKLSVNGTTLSVGLHDTTLVDVSFVLSSLLEKTNWITYIDIMHRKTLYELALYAYTTMVILSTERKVSQGTVDILQHHLYPFLTIDEVSSFLNIGGAFSYKHVKALFLSRFDDRLSDSFSKIDGLLETQRMQLSVSELRNIDSYTMWSMTITQLTQKWTEHESVTEQVSKLVTLVGDLKKDWQTKNPESLSASALHKYRIGVKQKLEAYFHTKGLYKSLSSNSIVSNVATLPALLAELQKLQSLGDTTEEDKMILVNLQTDVLMMMSASEKKGLNLILSSSHTRVLKLVDKFNPDEKEYATSMSDRLLYSLTFQEAWYHAVRLKGSLYEICFAASQGLKFCPESEKLTLKEIVQVFFPDKFRDFMTRSSKKHEVRDYKPDFFIPNDHIQLRPEKVARKLSLSSILDKGEFDTKGAESRYSGDNIIISWIRNTQDLSQIIRRLIKLSNEPSGRVVNSLGIDGPKDQDSFMSRQKDMLLVEVGYQTSAESKSTLDVSKWKPAYNILSSVGIQVGVLSFTENTEQMKQLSWVTSNFSIPLSKAIGYTFASLTEIMPLNKTSTLVGEISTQKLRALSSEGHIRTCPISSADLVTCHSKAKEEVFRRPNGVLVPLDIQKKFVKTHVFGSTMTRDDAVEVRKRILNSGESLIDAAASSKYKFSDIDELAEGLFYYGYYKEEIFLDAAEVGLCPMVEESAKAARKAVERLLQQDPDNKSGISQNLTSCDLAVSNYLLRKHRGHRNASEHSCELNNGEYRVTIKPVVRLLSLCSKIGKTAKRPESEGLQKSPIDLLASLTLPGRKGKQKDLKNKVRRFLEEVSSLSDDQFVKSELGLLYAPMRQILSKSGLTVNDNLRRVNISGEDADEAVLDRMKDKGAGEKKKHSFNQGKRKLLELIASVKKRLSYGTVAAARVVDAVELQLNSLKDYEAGSSKDLFEQLQITSSVGNSNLLDSIHLLMQDSINRDPLRTFFESRERKYEKMSDNRRKGYKFPVVSEGASLEYTNMCEDLCGIIDEKDAFNLINESVMSHVKETVTADTTAGICTDLIDSVLKVLSRFRLTKSLRAYGFVCQTFLTAVSEMSGSGVKLIKVPELKANLLMRVGSKKTSNISCLLLDESFSPMMSKFYMNRTIATLGQSLYSCYAVYFVQVVQMHSMSGAFAGDTEYLLSHIDHYMKQMLPEMTNYVHELLTTHHSAPEISQTMHDLFRQGVGESPSGTDPVRSTKTICRFILNMSYLIIPFSVRNNRKDNKLIQTVRHPYMLSLSEFGFPFTLGEKFSDSRRNLTSILMSRHLLWLSTFNLSTCPQRMLNWENHSVRPSDGLLSVTLFPMRCAVDRQFTSDMYFAHWYNKEMDDYNEGTIRVANEAFEKVMDWEQDLSQEIQAYNRLSSEVATLVSEKNSSPSKLNKYRQAKKEKSLSKMRICMLMGVKDVNTADVPDTYLVTDKSDKATEVQVLDQVNNSGNDLEGEVATIGAILGTVHPSLSTNAELGVKVEGRRIKSILKRPDSGASGSFEDTSANTLGSSKDSTSSNGRAKSRVSVMFSTDTLSQSSVRTIRDFGLSLSKRDLKQTPVHEVNLQYVVDASVEAAKTQKSYSYGVPELIQAAVELSKKKYSPNNILRAMTDKSNNEQISSISETTSTLASGIENADLLTALKTVVRKDAVKLTKTMTKQIRTTTTSQEKNRSISKQLDRLIMTPNESLEDELKATQSIIEALKKETRLDWRSAVNLDIYQLLLTENPSYLFRAMKTLWRDIRRQTGQSYSAVRAKSKQLISQVRVLENGGHFHFRTKEELDSLLKDIDEGITKVREEAVNMVLSQIEKSVPSRSNVVFKDGLYSLMNLVFESLVTIAEIKEFERSYPDTARPDLVSKLKDAESRLSGEYGWVVCPLVLLLLSITICNPFIIGSDHLNSYILSANKQIFEETAGRELRDIFDPDSVEEINRRGFNTQGETTKYIMNRLFKSSQTLGPFLNVLGRLGLEGHFESTIEGFHDVLVKLIFNIQEPFTTLLADTTRSARTGSEMTRILKELISSQSSQMLERDLLVTVTDIVTGSIMTASRVLNRSVRTIALPRSVRSKVIYQMYELSVENKTTNVQELAFQLALDDSHRFYGGLAPKAQIGGDRDLIVQERKTKIVVHANEMFSKSLMTASVSNDGLTNPKLKEEILRLSAAEMEQAKRVHGTSKKPGTKEIYMVYNVVGDCSKWGPIHSTSFFSCGSQQLLKDVEGWSSYAMLVLYKSLFKRVEIPIASIEKIIRSLLMSRSFRLEAEKAYSDSDKKSINEIIVKHVESMWADNPIVVQTVRDHLAKGRAYVRSYSHMGQGIHHRKSSEHASTCHIFIDDVVGSYIETQLPLLFCKIEHAGSSDDFSKIIKITGQVGSVLFKTKVDETKLVVKRALRLMQSLMRACQMMVSVKSCVSSFVSEFYSEFNLYDSVSPPVLKFVSNQLINHSVTTPLSLYQTCLVESQQAMYMGVPMATIVLFAMMKQQIFIENSRFFFDKWGSVVFNSFPQLCRFFIPTYSRLVAGSSSQEEIQILISSIEKVADQVSKMGLGRDSESSRTSFIPQEDYLASELYDDSASIVASESSGARSIKKDRALEMVVDESDVGNMSDLDIMEGDDVSSFGTSVDNETTAVINLIMWRYYTSEAVTMENVGAGDRMQELLRTSDKSSWVSDPFIQIMPESVMVQVQKLSDMKKKLSERIPLSENESAGRYTTFVQRLIGATTVTDTFEIEVDRIRQAFSSKHIVRGLAGGLREFSIPVHRQMIRSYFFYNRMPFSMDNHWVTKDQSGYKDDPRVTIPGRSRVKISDVLSRLSTAVVISHERAIEKMSVLGIDHNIHLFNTLTDSMTSLTDIPVDLVDSSLLKSPTSGEKADDSDVLWVVINTRLMRQYLTLIKQIRSDVMSAGYLELASLENQTINGRSPITGLRIRKQMLYDGSGREHLHNKVSVLVAAKVDYEAMVNTRPRGVDASRLSSEIETVSSMHPFLLNWVELNLERLTDTGQVSEANAGPAPKTATLDRLVSEAVTYCRMIEQAHRKRVGLFMFQPELKEGGITNYQLLIQNNTIEGEELLIESTRLPALLDTLVFSLMGVISVINWKEETEEKKIMLLKRFLNTNMLHLRSAASSLSDNCKWCSALSGSGLQEVSDTVSNFLSVNTRTYRTGANRKLEESISELTKLTTGWSTTVLETPITAGAAHVSIRGSSDSFSITVSTRGGTGAGHYSSPVLYLTVQGDVPSVLTSCETHVLRKLGLDVGRLSPDESRTQFLRLLPIYSDTSFLLSDNLLFVKQDRSGNYRILRTLSDMSQHLRDQYHVITRSDLPLAAKYTEPNQKSRRLKVRWHRNSLEIGVITHSKDVELPDSWQRVEMLAKQLLKPNVAVDFSNRLNSSSQWYSRAMIPLSSTVSSVSMSIYHIIKMHPVEMITAEPFYSRQVTGVPFRQVEMRKGVRVPTDAVIPSLKKQVTLTDNEAIEVFSEAVGTLEGGISLNEPIRLLADFMGIPFGSVSYGGFGPNKLSTMSRWTVDLGPSTNFDSIVQVMASVASLRSSDYTYLTSALVDNCAGSKDEDNFLNSLSIKFSQMLNNVNRSKLYISIILCLLETVVLPNLMFVNSGGLSVIQSLLGTKSSAPLPSPDDISAIMYRESEKTVVSFTIAVDEGTNMDEKKKSVERVKRSSELIKLCAEYKVKMEVTVKELLGAGGPSEISVRINISNLLRSGGTNRALVVLLELLTDSRAGGGSGVELLYDMIMILTDMHTARVKLPEPLVVVLENLDKRKKGGRQLETGKSTTKETEEELLAFLEGDEQPPDQEDPGDADEFEFDYSMLSNFVG